MAVKLLSVLALAGSSLLLQGNVGLRTNLDQRLLAAHNRERATLGIAPLHWNAGLAAGAAEWGAEMAATDEFEHSPTDPNDENPEGENLFAGTKGHFSPEAMVEPWIAEKSVYKAGIFPDNSRTGDYEDVGHYTQLMWRNTGQVGCAVVPGKQLDYLVCRYSQAGNMEGERPF